jgi:4,5-DOPA dioxygenase extradiol
MASDIFPALFIGHGSPMNIVSDNSYTREMKNYAAKLPIPDAILVVSAHWLTDGARITGALAPDQIYDFYGFPKELYSVKHVAPGSREIAKLAADALDEIVSVRIDERRGIDHAAWAPLSLLYPEQKIPVLELSIDIDRPPRYHFELGRRLAGLRTERILVIGSGNIVHNLGEIDWDPDASPFKWAIEFDELAKKAIIARVVHYQSAFIEARRRSGLTSGFPSSSCTHLPAFHETARCSPF